MYAAGRGAAGAYGSTIRSYTINSSGFAASGAEATIGPITLSGAVDIWGTVIDSRLRSAVMTKTIQVVPYSKPWFTSTPAVIRSNASGEEDANGEYIAITAAWDCAVKDKNTCAGTYRITPVSGSASALAGTLTSGVKTVVQASSDYSWAVSITLTDALASSPYTATVPTGSTLMDFRAGGKGIAIGKVAETDGFDVDMVTQFRRDVDMLGTLTLPITGILKGTPSGITNAVAGVDYDKAEIGTWTPVLQGYSGTAPTVSYSSRYGDYMKIGNMVWFRCGINATISNAGTGYSTIGGLPFAAYPMAKNRANYAVTVGECYGLLSGATSTAGTTSTVFASINAIVLSEADGNTMRKWAADWGSIVLSGFYITN